MKVRTKRLIKNIIKYTVGLPCVLAVTAFIVLFGSLIAMVDGEWDIISENLRGVWKPIR